MESKEIIEGSNVKVRLFSYKSFRHYGGRVINTTPHICNAIFIKIQEDNTYLVELSENCASFKKGHKIAVLINEFNVQ